MHVDIQPFAEYAVAPYVGAWIETIIPSRVKRKHIQSHPTWVRGLKHISVIDQNHPEVAPYVGAWIETYGINPFNIKVKSHPTWVRGLKLTCL